MKITIVTLSFNQRRFLDRALESVFQQEYSGLEYIIVDPGSSDGSRNLLERHRSRFAQLVFEPDRGAADGLNKGFALATGDIFGFLNADDVLLPRALVRVAEYFASHAECDVLMGDGFIVDANDRVLRHVRVRPFTVDRYLYSGVTWLQQATFFRAKSFGSVGGFNVANRSSWDGELLLAMARQGLRFEYLHENLGSYRQQGESITSHIKSGDCNPVVAIHRENTRRMFEAVKGREWGVWDDLVTLGYRLERLALNPSALSQAVLHRIRERR